MYILGTTDSIYHLYYFVFNTFKVEADPYKPWGGNRSMWPHLNQTISLVEYFSGITVFQIFLFRFFFSNGECILGCFHRLNNKKIEFLVKNKISLASKFLHLSLW